MTCYQNFTELGKKDMAHMYMSSHTLKNKLPIIYYSFIYYTNEQTITRLNQHTLASRHIGKAPQDATVKENS